MFEYIKEKLFYKNPLDGEMTEGQVYDADVGDIVLVKGCLQVWAKTSPRRWTHIGNDYQAESICGPLFNDKIGWKESSKGLFKLKPL